MQHAVLRRNPSGSYKLRLVVSRGEKFSGRRIQLGLGTRDRECALGRARTIVDAFRREGVCRNVEFRCFVSGSAGMLPFVWAPVDGSEFVGEAIKGELETLVNHCLGLALNGGGCVAR